MVNDDTIKSIDATFDDKGIMEGFAQVDYFEGQRLKGNFVQGVLHGLARYYIDEIDEETNMAKSAKFLTTVQYVQTGTPVGSKWTFMLNGMKIFHFNQLNDVLLFIPETNLTER
jgi:hypothetical protein